MFTVYNNGIVDYKSSTENLYNVKNINESKQSTLNPEDETLNEFQRNLNQNNQGKKQKNQEQILSSYKKISQINQSNNFYYVKDIMSQDLLYIDNSHTVKEAYELLRDKKTAQIPVMIVFEGWGAAGKGTLINRLIGPLDPRGFKVYTIQKASEEEAMRPFLWRFWTKTPANGRIHVFDRSWYRRIFEDRMEGKKLERDNQKAFGEIVHFEQELAVDGMVIIKFFFI